jgi:hypothetical protein
VVIDLSGWAALILALAAFVPAVMAAAISLMAFLESRHNTRQIDQAQKGVEQVHEIVNSQKTAMLAEIVTLKGHVQSLYNRLGKVTDEREIDATQTSV